MVRVSLNGPICPTTRATSKRIKFKATVRWSGLMESNIQAHGEITRCMARVYLSGQMVEFMRASTMRTRNMVLARFSGRMEKYTKASGRRDYKMAKADSRAKTEFGGMAFGRMAKESSEPVISVDKYVCQ
jgi:hypothetical protein